MSEHSAFALFSEVGEGSERRNCEEQKRERRKIEVKDERSHEERGNERRFEERGEGHMEHINYLCAYSLG